MDVIGKMNKFQDKENREIMYCTITILLCFIFFPLFFFTKIEFLSLFVAGCILILSFAFKKSISILVLGISFTIPYNTNNSDIAAVYIWWPVNIIRGLILFWLVVKLFNKRQKNKVLSLEIVFTFIAILLITLFYSINNGDFSDVINWLNTFIYFYLFFYLVYNENNTINYYFKLFDVIFICTVVYVILEFIFKISPYQILYVSGSIGEVDYYEERARGLLGHPLLLSSFIVIYQTTLYLRLILFNKFKYILFLLTVVVGILTNSRTTILVMVFFVIYYFFINKIYKSPKKLMLLFFTLIMGCLAIFSTMESFVEKNIERFHENAAGHRMAGYQTTFQYFSDHNFGTGYTNLFTNIKRGGYAAKGLIENFGTFDNFFLTQIAAYGIFSILIFYFYFYFVLKAYRYRKIEKKIYHCFLLLFFCWVLVGLSFNLEANLCILLFFSTLYAILVKEIRKNIKKRKSLNYNIDACNNNS
jgi:oligosaccharide repeat unit polymerase